MVATGSRRLNRKQRKELARRLQAADPGLTIVHPDAAGIDVGNSTHYVAVRPDRDPTPCVGSTASPPICTDWPIGCSSVA